MLTLDVRGAAPPAAAIAVAADTLRAGGVVVLPTDTVYGLAALPTVAGATDRVFALKGRGPDVPLAVLCADAAQALALADEAALSAEARRLAERLWPGPLTVVLRRRPDLGYALGQPEDTVGVRCPAHLLVQALAREVGPIATTSANPHGLPTPPTAPEVAAALGLTPDDPGDPGDTGDSGGAGRPGAGALGGAGALVLDGGPCAGTPSSVVDATTGEWRLLRQGALSLADLRAAATG
jgi:L-threonylcarbamoyladenylate synthase